MRAVKEPPAAWTNAVVLMLSSAVVVAACGALSPRSGLPPSEYVGCYHVGFESGFFAQAPVHSESELWFVASAPAPFFATVKDMIKLEEEAEIYLRVRAELGPKGWYGHMGLGSREMHIHQVIEFRMNTREDGPCLPPPPAPPVVGASKSLH